jgi:hypothetical protein
MTMNDNCPVKPERYSQLTVTIVRELESAIIYEIFDNSNSVDTQ